MTVKQESGKSVAVSSHLGICKIIMFPGPKNYGKAIEKPNFYWLSVVFGHSGKKYGSLPKISSISGHGEEIILHMPKKHKKPMNVKSENDMSFFKVRENFDFKFPKEKIIQGLTSYLNGQNWNLSYYNDRAYVYGIKIQEQLSQYLKKYTYFKFEHDLLCFALLKDHKNVLSNLCEILYKDQIINETILNKSKIVKEKIQLLFMFFLKTKFISEKDIVKIFIKMSSILDEVIQIETEYIPHLVDAISNMPDSY